MKAFDPMVAKDTNDEEPLYRPKRVQRAMEGEARRKKKEKEGSNESVVFVPATPGGVLKRSYEKAISEAGVRIAVAEIPGTNLKGRL